MRNLRMCSAIVVMACIGSLAIYQATAAELRTSAGTSTVSPKDALVNDQLSGATAELESGAVVAPNPLGTPTIGCGTSTEATINLEFCGSDDGGAPAGFSLQWMTCDAYDNYSGPMDANQWPADSSVYCKGSFSGVPACSEYKVGEGDCIGGEHDFLLQIGQISDDACGASVHSPSGDPEECLLECGTCYVFRAFSHNVPGGRNRSPFTGPPHLRCSTEGDTCDSCTRTQGYWKNHGPGECASGNNSNEWPVSGLSIGGTMYSDEELCTNFGLSGGGNAVTILSHQLITTLLNLANNAGANCYTSEVAGAIAAGHTLLTGRNINTDTCSPGQCGDDRQAMIDAANVLDLFNSGTCHCD